MTTLYNNIELGDTITLPNTNLAVKSGVIVSIKKINQFAKQVTCSNGAKFAVSKFNPDYVLTVEAGN